MTASPGAVALGSPRTPTAHGHPSNQTVVAETPLPGTQAGARRDSLGQSPPSLSEEHGADGSCYSFPCSSQSPSASGMQRRASGTDSEQQSVPVSGQANVLDDIEVRSIVTLRDGSSAADQATTSATVHFCALWDSEAFIQNALRPLPPGASTRPT